MLYSNIFINRENKIQLCFTFNFMFFQFCCVISLSTDCSQSYYKYILDSVLSKLVREIDCDASLLPLQQFDYKRKFHSYHHHQVGLLAAVIQTGYLDLVDILYQELPQYYHLPSALAHSSQFHTELFHPKECV